MNYDQPFSPELLSKRFNCSIYCKIAHLLYLEGKSSEDVLAHLVEKHFTERIINFTKGAFTITLIAHITTYINLYTRNINVG